MITEEVLWELIQSEYQLIFADWYGDSAIEQATLFIKVGEPIVDSGYSHSNNFIRVSFDGFILEEGFKIYN